MDPVTTNLTTARPRAERLATLGVIALIVIGTIVALAHGDHDVRMRALGLLVTCLRALPR